MKSMNAALSSPMGGTVLEIRRGENPRSQNRPSKTRRGAAESVLGPWNEPSLISY